MADHPSPPDAPTTPLGRALRARASTALLPDTGARASGTLAIQGTESQQNAGGQPGAEQTAAELQKRAEQVTVGQQEGGHRYAFVEQLGAGGMGEVNACKDLRLDRMVAVKRLHAHYRQDAALVERFWREARIQARLEHPAIVPLHDLGQDEGLPYFAMKRVQGVTLKSVLRRLAKSEAQARAQYSRHKLLTAFSTAVRAIAYAHAHGVVHRDLKPDNIMLGDFGEVYVIDWGISKELGSTDLPTDPARRSRPDTTEAGAMLGTPGYIAPEHVLEGAAHADRRGDVYALGAILFELLVLQPLNRGDSTEDRVRATVLLPDVRTRAAGAMPDLPPELLSVCERATHPEPAQRYADAGELAEALERVLEGKRDLELRRKLAAAVGEQAAQQASQACASGGLAERRAAMATVGQALALDPHNEVALSALLRLLSELPEQRPAEVDAAVEDDHRRDIRQQSVLLALSYASMLVFLPVAWWMGVRNWPLVLGLTGLVVMAVLSTLAVGRLWPASERGLYPALLFSSLVVAGTSAFFGPLIAVPGMAAINGTAFVTQLRGKRTYLALLLSMLAFLLPCVLQLAGVLPPSYSFAGGSMRVEPLLVDIAELPAVLFLILSGVGVVATAALSFIRFGRALDHERRRLHLSAWHMRQLLPEVAQRTLR